MSTLSVGFILTCIFVGCVGLMGIFTLFVKAENIERNVLVGGLTLCSTLVAIILLDHDFRTDFPYGGGMLVSVCFLAVLGFGLGRVIDALLGARSEAFIEDATLGSDLAD